MRRLRLAPLLAVVLVLCAAAGAAAQVTYTPDTPKAGALYEYGPSGRYLMGGQWLFRRDTTGAGLSQHWQRQASTAGWSLTTVPERLERDRRVRGLDARRRRLVSQGLPPAEQRQALLVGRSLRVGQLPLVGVAQRQAAGLQHRRLPAVRVRDPGQRAQARRDEPARRARRLAAARARTSRRRATTSRAARSAAGGTTAASCARSTCAASRARTSPPSRSARCCRARPARRRCASARSCATPARSRAPSTSPPRSAASPSGWGRRPSAAAATREFTGSLKVRPPGPVGARTTRRSTR